MEGEIIDSCPGYFSNKLEQKHTNKNIKEYGYNNVRGGKYTNSQTLKSNKKYMNNDEYSDDNEYYDDNEY